MNTTNLISFVDSHAAGCPIRVLTGGIPPLRGATMLDKMLDMQKNHDALRVMTMCEPRGHRQMVGAVLTEPVSPEADVGVFYIDPGWYAPMCGAGAIALSRVLVEMGLVPIREPVTRVRMDTPAGIVDGYAQVENGAVRKVWFQNVDSFVYRTDLELEFHGKKVTYDITYGGNFFVSLPVGQFGLELVPENSGRLADLGMELLREINRQVEVVHPRHPGITFLNDIQFTQPALEQGGEKVYRNTVIFGAGQTDRSPCGTGSCARMAALYRRGELALGETFIHESIMGTRFYGKVLSAREEDGCCYVACQLSGEPHITAMGHFVADQNDGVSPGFLL